MNTYFHNLDAMYQYFKDVHTLMRRDIDNNKILKFIRASSGEQYHPTDEEIAFIHQHGDLIVWLSTYFTHAALFNFFVFLDENRTVSSEKNLLFSEFLARMPDDAAGQLHDAVGSKNSAEVKSE